jgi:hypothetical protein
MFGYTATTAIIALRKNNEQFKPVIIKGGVGIFQLMQK